MQLFILFLFIQMKELDRLSNYFTPGTAGLISQCQVYRRKTILNIALAVLSIITLSLLCLSLVLHCSQVALCTHDPTRLTPLFNYLVEYCTSHCESGVQRRAMNRAIEICYYLSHKSVSYNISEWNVLQPLPLQRIRLCKAIPPLHSNFPKPLNPYFFLINIKLKDIRYLQLIHSKPSFDPSNQSCILLAPFITLQAGK